MAYTYNPNDVGGRDWEDHSLRTAHGKISETPLQPIKVSMMYTCHPNYVEGINRRIPVQSSPGKNVKSYLKNS
jgi:hypothetical protein